MFFNGNLNILIYNWSFSLEFNRQRVSMGLRTGSELFSRQAIVWIHVDIVHRRMYASAGVTELRTKPLRSCNNRNGDVVLVAALVVIGGVEACPQRVRRIPRDHPGDLFVSVIISLCLCTSIYSLNTLMWFYVCLFLSSPYKHYHLPLCFEYHYILLLFILLSIHYYNENRGLATFRR